MSPNWSLNGPYKCDSCSCPTMVALLFRSNNQSCRENADIGSGNATFSTQTAKTHTSVNTTMTSAPSETFWTPKKGAFGKINCRLEPDVERKRVAGIKSCIQKFGLDTASKVSITRTKRGGRKGPQPEKKSTLSDCLLCIRQIGEFAARLGDCRTAATCDRDKCPSNPHPADPKTLVLFFEWKSGAMSTPLVDLNGNPVKDLNQRTISCAGDCHTPQCLNKCDGAIKTLHDAHENCRGACHQPCKDCLRANAMSTVQPAGIQLSCASCTAHANQPKIALFGDPCLSDACKKHCDEIRKFLQSTHKVRGNSQLSPSMLRALHAKLAAGGDIHEFQMWVMIVVGVCLVLRADELLKLKIEDFDMEHNIVHPNSVRNVAVHVQGKCDPCPQLLSLWKNDEFPEFCPIRALFSCLKVTKIRSGFVFPNRKFLVALVMNTAKSRGEDAERHKHSSWLTKLKRILTKAFPNMCGPSARKQSAVGTHALRKTGCSVAVWGVLRAMKAQFGTVRADDFKPNLLFEDILRCARHKSAGMAASCVLDAISQHERVQEERFVANQVVSMWKSFKIDEVQHAGDVNGASSPCVQSTLPLQVDWWHAAELVACRGDHVSQMHSAACVKKGSVATETQLVELVSKLGAGDDDLAQAKWSIANLQREAASEKAVSDSAVAAASDAGVESGSDDSRKRTAAKSTKSTDNDNDDDPKAKKQRRGDQGFEEERNKASAMEKNCKKKPTKDNGSAVLSAWDSFCAAVDKAGGCSSLADGAPRKCCTNRRKNKACIRACIDDCFNGDEEAFFGQFPSFPAARGKPCVCAHTTSTTTP